MRVLCDESRIDRARQRKASEWFFCLTSVKLAQMNADRARILVVVSLCEVRFFVYELCGCGL